jgi:hypothetical protein
MSTNTTKETGEEFLKRMKAEKAAIERRVFFHKPSFIYSLKLPNEHKIIGDHHIDLESFSVTGGAPGVGKSRAGLAVAHAGAVGSGEWFGLEVHRNFKTLIIQNENGLARLQNEIGEIHAKLKANGIDFDDWCLVTDPPPYGLQFHHEDFRAQVTEAILDFKPDIIVIDPWNAVAQRVQQEDYLSAFEHVKSVIAKMSPRPHVNIAAHTRKPKAEERHSGRALLNLLSGSLVLGSVPRCVFVMQSATDDTEDQRIVWTCCKNNDGELGPRSAWIRRNGLFLNVPDFDFESFDSDGKSKNILKAAVPELLAENFTGLITKKHAAEWLSKKTGKHSSSMYRWLDDLIGEDSLQENQAGMLILT